MGARGNLSPIAAVRRSAAARAITLALIGASISIVWLATSAIAAEPTPTATQAATKTLLLLGQGPDGHPVGTHEYQSGLERLAGLLEPTAGLKVRVIKVAEPWTDGPSLINEADGVVLFLAEGARWVSADPRCYEALSKLAARGGGFSVLHWAMGTKSAEPIEPFLKLFGGCHGGPDRKYQVLETDLALADPTHPIAAGLENFRARDEFYYRLKFVSPAGSVRPILTARIDGQDETVSWAWQRPDGGRSFGFSGLHFNDNWQLAPYSRLITQGVKWTMKVPN